MVVGETHNKKPGVHYQKVLNKKDPFDQLILELGQIGVLQVSVVGIDNQTPVSQAEEYSRKALVHRGKHSA